MKQCVKRAWLGLWVWLAGTLVGMSAPVNDNFADRIVLSGTVISVHGSTVGGTLEDGEPLAFHVLSTVWYEWVAPQSGQVRVRLEEMPSSLVTYIHSGTVLDGLKRVGQFWSNLEENMDVQEGVAYQFQIGPNQPVPWPRFEGPFRLRLEYNVAPVNDHYTNRLHLSHRVERLTFRNTLATLEPGEARLGSAGGYSVWYEWRAPESGLAHILPDNLSPVVVGIYEAGPLTTGNEITNSVISGSSHCWSELVFPVAGGGTYAIVFDNCAGEPGSMAATLTVNGAARLEPPQRRLEGGVQMSLFGERDRTYVLQASSNLTDWTPLSTNYYYTPLILEDPTVLPHRFYRVHLSP